MIIVTESARALKTFIAKTSLSALAQAFVLRMVLTFIMHAGRMSCSQAAGCVASETFHRGQLTRFLRRPRWQRHDFNAPLQQEESRPQAMPQFYVWLADCAVGISHPLADPALYQGVLCRAGAATSNDR